MNYKKLILHFVAASEAAGAQSTGDDTPGDGGSRAEAGRLLALLRAAHKPEARSGQGRPAPGTAQQARRPGQKGNGRRRRW